MLLVLLAVGFDISCNDENIICMRRVPVKFMRAEIGVTCLKEIVACKLGRSCSNKVI